MKEIISKYSIVALDTVIFIYHFEKSKTYFKLTKEIFSRLDDDGNAMFVHELKHRQEAYHD